MASVTGGDKIRDVFKRLADNLASAKSVQVGFLEDATYPDGMSVATVAALNEYGHAHTPPRPFFRNMIRAKSGRWPQGLRQALADNDYEASVALDLLGATVAGQLQESITELRSPPLAPSTIRAKGFDKPLIDTGHMLSSVSYRVVQGETE